ncbi:hypothetical protein [Amycolatopsis sp. NPDC051128]|uniref:hypothetical protein n=1 Tax=Amycolatopsis sp. NPDC051128 TaxID=3155412 RepID=UPI003414A762
MRHYRQALVLYRELGCSYDEADTLERLGDTYLALGDADQAHDTWQWTLKLYHTQNRPHETVSMASAPFDEASLSPHPRGR